MKIRNLSILLLSVFILFSCQIKKTENSAISVNNNSESTIEIDTAFLKGIWWESIDAPVASFVIKDSTIYYPDQEVALSEFKYSLINDSLKIFKPDMSEAYKIMKITKDTLVLGSEFGLFTFNKIQE